MILQPDEEKAIPDALAYVDELDDEGRPTGNKVILPALKAQERLGAITIKETKKAVKKEEPKEEPVAEPAEEDTAEATAEEPKKTTGRGKKKAE